MKQLSIIRAIDIAVKPIRHNFIHFAMLFFLASGFQIFSQFLMQDPLRMFNVVTMTMWGLIIAYIASAIILILPPRWPHKIAVIIIYTLLSLSTLTDIIIYATLQLVWNENFPGILAATNSQESAEFVEYYFSGSTIIWIVGWMVFSLLYYQCIKLIIRHKLLTNRWKNYITFIISGMVVVSALYIIRVPDTKAFATSVPGKLYSMRFFKQVEEIEMPELELTDTKESHIPTVFLIIGESHSRSHSQLYGYDKTNMPRLSSLPSDKFVVFSDIESPGTHTQESFKTFMTPSDYSNILWYKSNNVIQLMKEAGYRITWISNQNCRGVHENVISRFANLSDTTLWTSDKYSIEDFTLMSRYDESLLTLYDKLDHSSANKNFFIFHLMGSHVKFSCRYPPTFKGFSANEYQNYPENQRSNLAAYDTSILYTDYVLSEIFKRAEKVGAIAIYFSDHGLDVYNSEPTRCSHANPNNPESVMFGKQIPFMVYIPESFEQEHPELVQRIHKASSQGGNTNQLFFTLMDILGATSPQWPDAADHSLFHVKE